LLLQEIVEMVNTNWFERVPKAELHVHLEGSIPLDVLWQLVQKYGGAPDVPDLQALEKKFAYRDFPHFLETWVWKNGFLREYEDFVLVAEAVARDLAAQNIRYAEVFFSPSDFARHGLETQRLVEAIRAGLVRASQAKAPLSCTISLVADLVRDNTPEKATAILAELVEVQGLGGAAAVLGISIGGAEQAFPPEPFQEVYKQARDWGFHTSAHAGEAAGAGSIWGAIRSLKVDRIGHGTRAYEDESLLDYLAERRIPLEMCPLSNVRTGVVASVADHPIRHYFERSIVVTVNTDDPKMFGNSLAQEYALLQSELGFSRDEIRALILQGIEASWLPPADKRKWIEAFCSDPSWQDDDC
jgi:adenosine deaminase